MQHEIKGIDPIITNPNNPGKNQAPLDPSNTSNIGQKVEQEVIDTKEGISEQSGKWEDKEERGIEQNGFDEAKTKELLKKPAPEEITFNEEENI